MRSAGIWPSLGIISAKGRNGTAELFGIIANTEDERIPPIARFCLELLARHYTSVTAEIRLIDKRIHAWHRACKDSRRLEEIPGIGPIVASRFVPCCLAYLMTVMAPAYVMQIRSFRGSGEPVWVSAL